jgi:hypothetical protein
MCLSDSDLLIGESGFPAFRQTLLHYGGGLFACGHGNPLLAFLPLGSDDDLKAVNKSLCHQVSTVEPPPV